MDPLDNMSGAPVPKNFDAENAQNNEDVRQTPRYNLKHWRLGSLTNSSQIEKQFAVKVVQHMQTYWSILERVKGSTLRLTKIDDEIMEHLKEAFPEFDPAAKVDEDEMKSKDGKNRWREFMMKYEKKVDDYNFGTMVRDSPKVEYEENTTIFVPRMQFYAFEIAR
jgi:hypothetical protein